MSNFLSVPLYHVDLQENNQRFCKGDSLDQSIENGKWAGTGLYFWDNLGNAKYWIKSHWKNDPEKASIVETQLKVDQNVFWDLTEPETVRNFESQIESISKFALLNKNTENHAELIKKTSDLGAVINLYYKLLQDMGFSTFSVIKIIGYYPFVRDTKYFKEKIDLKNRSFKIAPVTIKSKTIYLIKDQNLLAERKILKKAEKN